MNSIHEVVILLGAMSSLVLAAMVLRRSPGRIHWSFALGMLPMIRYRTGDVGALEEVPCPCGRGLPRLRSIEGRQTDFLVTPAGKVMHALAAIYILREVPSIREFQVIQERLDRVSVTIVPDAGFSEPAQEALASRLARLFDDGVQVEILVAASIARPPSGKHRYVISNVAREYLDSLLAVK